MGLRGPKPISLTADYLRDRVEFDTNAGCWLWTGNLTERGYGELGSRPFGRTSSRLAHRASYRVFKGEIAPGLMVLHSCDVRSCVNPDHLRVGTGADNNDDMVKRGRDCHPLSPEQSQLAVERYRAGQPQNQISQEMGVSYWIVGTALRRAGHIPPRRSAQRENRI